MPDTDPQAGQGARAASGGGALKPDVTLTTSYHAYKLGALRGSDKAFTPCPAVVQHRIQHRVQPVLSSLRGEGQGEGDKQRSS